jgi:hypothetical protein
MRLVLCRAGITGALAGVTTTGAGIRWAASRRSITA